MERSAAVVFIALNKMKCIFFAISPLRQTAHGCSAPAFSSGPMSSSAAARTRVNDRPAFHDKAPNSS
jgi:hypothetical protein